MNGFRFANRVLTGSVGRHDIKYNSKSQYVTTHTENEKYFLRGSMRI